MNTFDITHFNAGTRNEGDFLSGFIARQDSLRFYVGQVKGSRGHQAGRHNLIVAPRGYGKTSLLRRIFIYLRDDPELSKEFIPLSFREEQHNVISLDVFWRNCLLSLLETREDEKASDEELEKLESAWRELSPRGKLSREQQNGEVALSAFAHYCDEMGRRPVLLVDNIDTLLAGLPVSHQWELRAVLQRTNGPILIAASSRILRKLNESSAPFHDFFRLSTLKPLRDGEVLDCLRELAIRRGTKGQSVLKMIDDDPGRITALNTMAGGNPRTLGVLYTVLESHMSDDVLSQLAAMLDTFTGWYQARTEELSLQARAVFDALALNWDPMTAAEIANVTGLETTVVSSNLNRLEKGGFAESLQFKRSRKLLRYQVSERFYNIWYLMRNGSRHTRQKVKFLAIFLRSCFSNEELYRMAKENASHGIKRAESLLALAACIEDLSLRAALVDSAKEDPTEKAVAKDFNQLVHDVSEILSVTARQFAAKPVVNNELMMEVLEYMKADDGERAEALLREAIENSDQKDSGPGWLALGSVLHYWLARPQEALDAYENAIPIDSVAASAALWSQYGDALQELGRYVEAESAYRKAINLEPADVDNTERLADLLARNLKKYDEAISCWKKVVESKKDYFMGWYRLADCYIDAGNMDAAEEAFETALKIESKSPLIWNGAAHFYEVHRKDPEKAEEYYRRSLGLDENNLRALNGLASVLIKNTERLSEAEALLNKAISLNKENALSLRNLAKVYQKQRRFDDAEVLLQSAVRLAPSVAVYSFELGVLRQFELSKYELAAKDYANAIAIHPLTSAKAVFADLLQNYLGDMDRSLQLNLEVLQEQPDNLMALENIYCLRKLLRINVPDFDTYASRLMANSDEHARRFFEAVSLWGGDLKEQFEFGWAELASAIKEGGGGFWLKHSDAVERLLAFAWFYGMGLNVIDAMERENFQTSHAPLYRAFVALNDGDDYLEAVNPEVRGVATTILTSMKTGSEIFKRIVSNAK